MIFQYGGTDPMINWDQVHDAFVKDGSQRSKGSLAAAYRKSKIEVDLYMT